MTFTKSPTNARNWRQIGARSCEWQSRSVNDQRLNRRESLTCRRHPRNSWHAKYPDLSSIENPAVWNDFWLKNTPAMTYSQWELGGGLREVQGEVIWNVVCGPDRVVGDSSYCKVMQCVTSCRRYVMQCEHSSSWMQRVVQSEINRDPTTLKLMQCELSIRKCLVNSGNTLK